MGDVEIAYKPTGSMWSDILTELKQGSVFGKFRGHLMNVPTDHDDEAERLRTYPLCLMCFLFFELAIIPFVVRRMVEEKETH